MAARRPKNNAPKIQHTCGECALGKWIEEHSNKDYKGEYICLRCPHRKCGIIRNEPACEHFKPKQ